MHSFNISFMRHRSPHKEMKTERSGKPKYFYTRLKKERQLWKTKYIQRIKVYLYGIASASLPF